jgi:hypothetical protein
MLNETEEATVHYFFFKCWWMVEGFPVGQGEQ